MASTRAAAASPIGCAASFAIDARNESGAALMTSAPQEGNAAVGAQHDRRSRLRREDLAVEYDRAFEAQPAFAGTAAVVSARRHPRPRAATDDRKQRAPEAAR